MSNQEDIKNLMPTPVLRLFDNKDMSRINAVLYEMLAELDEMRGCFPICVTDLTSVVSSYETSQQERKSDGHIKSRHQTQGF